MSYKELRDIYFGIFEREPERNNIIRWCKNISTSRGKVTTNEFRNSIINSKDYKEKIRQTFKDAFMDIIGDNNDNGEEQTRLYKEYVTNMNIYETTKEEMKNFLREQEIFQKKYKHIVSRIFSSLKKTNPSEEIIQYFVNKFKKNDYTIANLNQDIKDFNMEDIVLNNNLIFNDNGTITLQEKIKNHDKTVVDLINKKYKQNVNRNATDSETIELLELINSKESLIDFYINTRNFNQNMIDEIIKTYEEKEKEQTSVKTILKIYENVNKIYSVVGSVFREYMSANITTKYIIDNYYRYAKPDNTYNEQEIRNTVINEIMSLKTYENKLITTIDKIYRSMYGQKLTNQKEIDFLISKMKADKIGTNNKNISKYILSFKNCQESIKQSLRDKFSNKDRVNREYEKYYKKYLDSVSIEKIIQEIKNL